MLEEIHFNRRFLTGRLPGRGYATQTPCFLRLGQQPSRGFFFQDHSPPAVVLLVAALVRSSMIGLLNPNGSKGSKPIRLLIYCHVVHIVFAKV